MSPERIRLEPTPKNACGPLKSALKIVSRDIQEMGGPSSDMTTDAGISTYAANTMASSCARLCVDGCARELHNRAESTGIALPPSQERETLFSLVSATLATELLFSPVELDRRPVPAVVTLETDGNDLREIIQRRLRVLNAPDLLDKLAAVGGHTTEEFTEAVEGFQTPIADDFYDELASFTNGNVRAALGITAYFMSVFPTFRSSRIEDIETAEVIREKGFHPGNPWEITKFDISTLADLVDEDGWLNLPESAYSYTCMNITDEPDKMRMFRRVRGEIIEVTTGGLPVLAPSRDMTPYDR